MDNFIFWGELAVVTNTIPRKICFHKSINPLVIYDKVERSRWGSNFSWLLSNYAHFQVGLSEY